MKYRIKDLIISIIPDRMKAAGCDANQSACTGKCSNADSDCPGGCSNGDTKFCGGASDKIVDPVEMIVDPAELIEMKEILQHVTATLDSAIHKSKQVKINAKEAEILEQKITAALTALKKG